MANQVGGESGNHEYEFISPPPDTLICGICRFPSKTPQFRFCELCVERAKRVDDTFRCPVCRLAFSCFTNKLPAPRPAQDYQRSLSVLYTKEGCE